MIDQLSQNTDVSWQSSIVQQSFQSTKIDSKVRIRGSPQSDSLTFSEESVHFSLKARYLQMRQIGDRGSAQGFMLNVSFQSKAKWTRMSTAKADDSTLGYGELDPELAKDLDLILKFLAKDDKEYRELSRKFRNIFKKMGSSLSSCKCPEVPDSQPQSVAAEMRELNFDISIRIEMKSTTETILPLKIQVTFRPEASRDGTSDPLIIDIDGDGVELTSMEDGVSFDIRGNGSKVQVAGVEPDDGLLVLDRNENGIIDSGKELFGDQNGAPHGFAELGKYDHDENGLIDSSDPVFDKLQVYRDFNRDGFSQKNELFHLKKMGIHSISLAFTKSEDSQVNGNSLLYEGWYTLRDGSKRSLTDAALAYRSLT
jgi:hypothetical protein